jgi:hypothetical protein
MRVVTALLLVASVSAEQKGNPVERVVQLIEGLKSKIIADGTAEQQVYDKYACWCEKTTARKAAAIENAKQLIDELSRSILEIKGRLGSYVAEIAKLDKDVAETKQAIEEAEEQRKKENADYLKKKSALELGLANLEKAIKVLAEATVDATPNLQKPDANRDAQAETKLLTIMAGVRSAMRNYNHFGEGSRTVNDGDVSAVKSFMSRPTASLIRTGANPAAGTYTSQSGQIQGILAQMKDDFEHELASSAEEEDAAASSHAELMETKREDLALLEKTLTKTTLNQGNDKKQLAEDSQEREETQVQLKTDEAFFAETKESCKAKADQWAGRARSRTEELAAIDKALAVLTSPESKAIFESSANTLVQLTSTQSSPERTKAYNLLKSVATKAGSLRLAAIATSVQTTWHFDAVIADIDKMIVALREEEKADIAHRDWCESQSGAANSKNENLEYDKEQLEQKKERANNKKAELEAEVEKTDSEMEDLQKAMDEALENRNKEHEAFKQAMKDDADAVMLIGKAIEALNGFYNPKMLMQQPEYTTNPDTAPEAEFSSNEGRKSEGGGVIAILSMIKEDIEKEMKTTRADEAEDLAAYKKLYKDSAASMKALETKKVSLGQDIAGKMKEIAGLDAVYADKEASKKATDDLLDALKPNCDWIARTFDTRMEQRKAEMKGLQDAKAVLAGADPKAGFMTTKVLGGQRSRQDALRELDATESNIGSSFLQRRA